MGIFKSSGSNLFNTQNTSSSLMGGNGSTGSKIGEKIGGAIGGAIGGENGKRIGEAIGGGIGYTVDK